MDDDSCRSLSMSMSARARRRMDDTLEDDFIKGNPGRDGGPRSFMEEDVPKIEPPLKLVVSGIELDDELPPSSPKLMISLSPLVTEKLLLNPSIISSGSMDRWWWWWWCCCCCGGGSGGGGRVGGGADEMRDELADMVGDLRPLEEKTNMVFFCFLMVGWWEGSRSGYCTGNGNLAI